MSEKYFCSNKVKGKFMEVIIGSNDGNEFIYWVNLINKHKGENEYDWAINVALNFHNKQYRTNLKETHAEAGEPFSRNENEFTFIN